MKYFQTKFIDCFKKEYYMLMRNSRLQDQIYTWKSIHYVIRQLKKNDSFDKQNIHCKPWQAKKEVIIGMSNVP